MVDPEVREVWGSPDFAVTCGGGPSNFAPGKWSYQQWVNWFTPICGNGDGGAAGLFVRSEPMNYFDTARGQWIWSPPAGAYIQSVWFDGMRHLAAGSYMYTGLYGQTWGSVTNHTNEFTYGNWTNTTNSPYNGWTAVFGLWMYGSYTRPHIGLAAVRGVNIRLGDIDPPWVTLQGFTGGLDGSNRSNWFDDSQAPAQATVQAGDGGLGLQDVGTVLESTKARLGGTHEACVGHRSSPCPQTRRVTFALGDRLLPEGLNLVQTWARDITDNSGYGPVWTYRIDRTPPNIDLSGELVDHATDGQLPANPTINIHATDGSPASPATHRSGVKRVRLLLDGTVLHDYNAPESACDNCDRGLNWTIPISSFGSSATVVVEAWDYLGHRSSASLAIQDPPDAAFDRIDGASLIAETFTPENGPPIDLTDLEAGASVIRIVYTPADPTGFRSNHTGTLTTQAKFAPPISFTWGFRLSSRIQNASLGPVTQRAQVFTYPKGRKINYDDAHIEPAGYFFHSSVTTIGIGAEYRLQIDFTMPAQFAGSRGIWRARVRQNFLMALV